MNTLKNLPWARFGFEGVLIVVSILAAFWIDSWQADQDLAVEEQELLRQLKAEFEVNIDLLAERRSQHATTEAAAQRILSVTSPMPEIADVSADILRQDMLRMVQWWTFDPQTGVLVGTIQSGKLGVVSSNRLRTKLASWPAQLQDLAEDEIFLAEFANGSIYPLLQATTTMRNYSTIHGVEPSVFPESFEVILGSLEFENVVSMKLAMTQEILGNYDEIAAEIDGTLALIEKELD